jgi:hypothetical protein
MSDEMSDEQLVREVWGDRAKIFEGGDGSHIKIAGVEHPHFYANLPSNAWSKAAEWTIQERKFQSREGEPCDRNSLT